jgi:hypothetical protein
MAAKPTQFSGDMLKLWFNGTAIAGLAQNATSGSITTLYVSLHTTYPGAGGTQSTGEAAYTGYARVAITRDGAHWIVTTNAVSPAADVVFPTATGGVETESYWGVGTAATGAGYLLYSGPIAPALNVSSGSEPILLASSTVTES